MWTFNMINHDDAIKWKLFPRYWPFVRGINQSLVHSHDKALIMRTVELPVIWYYTTSIWRHCNVERGYMRARWQITRNEIRLRSSFWWIISSNISELLTFVYILKLYSRENLFGGINADVIINHLTLYTFAPENFKRLYLPVSRHIGRSLKPV